MIHPARLTARPGDDFVVFLIGMRINRLLAVHKWYPVMHAMPAMLRELYRQPELGLLSHEAWFGRTVILVQYWRSVDQLIAYATSKSAAHLPAWQRFNRVSSSDDAVGIWHETYEIKRGAYENIYVNMPPFGLGKVGPRVEATGDLKSAAARMRQRL
jgi:hypothetical protein